MPLVNSTATSYDYKETNKADVSTVFFAKTLEHSTFYNNIAVSGENATNTTHSWWEDTNLQTETTLKTGSVTSASTTLSVKDANLNLHKGAILEVNSARFQVESISGNDITGEFVYIDAADVKSFAAAENDKVYFLNNALPEASPTKDRELAKEVMISNYTQIIDDAFSISGTQLSTTRFEALSDLVVATADKKMDRFRKIFARDIWNGAPFLPNNNQDARRMGGIYYYTNKYGYTSSISGALTKKNLDLFLGNAREVTGNDLTQIWLHPNDLAKLSGLLVEPNTVIQPNGQDIVIGNIPAYYKSDLGYTLQLITDTNCREGRLWLGKPSMIQLKALTNRSLTMQEIMNDKDGKQFRILGEYTMEFNPCSKTAYVDLKG